LVNSNFRWSAMKLNVKRALRLPIPAILLVFNTFVWYILTYYVFSSILDGLKLPQALRLELYIVYYAGAGIAAFLGPRLLRSSRERSLIAWMIIGAVATALLPEISAASLVTSFALVFSLGVSIMVGLPSCLGYFADSTAIGDRGMVAGIIWSAVGFGTLAVGFVINSIGLWDSIIVLSMWRLIGCGIFAALKKQGKDNGPRRAPGYLELARKREVWLYLFPWIMFCIVNWAEQPMLNTVFGPDFYTVVKLYEWALVGVFAIIGGFAADVIGRKRVVIAGFIMLGLEYAVLSLFSTLQVAWSLFLILDGTTWGLFASVFFTALWGDLAENYEKEKYYALGGLPYLLAGFLPIAIGQYPVQVTAVESFSLASFFLFASVIPLMYAPETLPEKKMKERELKIYIEKAQRVKQKYA
jgi:MFS family permease